MTVRVIVADDQEIVRTGLTMILNAQPDIEVVGEAANGQRALDLAPSSCFRGRVRRPTDQASTRTGDGSGLDAQPRSGGVVPWPERWSGRAPTRRASPRGNATFALAYMNRAIAWPAAADSE